MTFSKFPIFYAMKDIVHPRNIFKILVTKEVISRGKVFGDSETLQ